MKDTLPLPVGREGGEAVSAEVDAANLERVRLAEELLRRVADARACALRLRDAGAGEGLFLLLDLAAREAIEVRDDAWNERHRAECEPGEARGMNTEQRELLAALMVVARHKVFAPAGPLDRTTQEQRRTVWAVTMALHPENLK